MYDVAKELYEKLAVLKFIDEKLDHIEVDVSKNLLASRFEKMASAVMSENKSVPESNPHEEDIISHPGIDTIKDMVLEMPTEGVDSIFADFMAKPDGIEKDENFLEAKTTKESESPKSLNDRLNKELQIGLNDKLAFVKHLFNDQIEDYNRTLSQLATIDSEERSISFINNMVKPDYNNWQGKEEYEARFISHIERKFA